MWAAMKPEPPERRTRPMFGVEAWKGLCCDRGSSEGFREEWMNWDVGDSRDGLRRARYI